MPTARPPSPEPWPQQASDCRRLAARAAARRRGLLPRTPDALRTLPSGEASALRAEVLEARGAAQREAERQARDAASAALRASADAAEAVAKSPRQRAAALEAQLAAVEAAETRAWRSGGASRFASGDAERKAVELALRLRVAKCEAAPKEALALKATADASAAVAAAAAADARAADARLADELAARRAQRTMAAASVSPRDASLAGGFRNLGGLSARSRVDASQGETSGSGDMRDFCVSAKSTVDAMPREPSIPGGIRDFCASAMSHVDVATDTWLASRARLLKIEGTRRAEACVTRPAYVT
eukprot:TRINITY_DN14108_c0_g1_i1.p1 TRINITY_DN14108_c0_g1~~TRINITY_DN14108_c0_g1_i1.p1  ORF type:complete len:303 (-),score=83.72 TRINITY_DN14108_c0_g1_i1:846-1754(-)